MGESKLSPKAKDKESFIVPERSWSVSGLIVLGPVRSFMILSILPQIERRLALAIDEELIYNYNQQS